MYLRNERWKTKDDVILKLKPEATIDCIITLKDMHKNAKLLCGDYEITINKKKEDDK